MSGIYIPGVEMPNKKNGAVLIIYPDGKCAFEDGKTYQAVPIPPHGDLTDLDEYRDEFMNGVYALCSDDSDNYRANAIIDLFDAAPTIIPSSEESVKAEEDSEPWLCLSCRHYPPSSTDGKPCSQCNPSEVWHSCYDPTEESEI